MLQFLSHRGYWRDRAEQNGSTAFGRAWSRGYGIETDLRDLDGRIVISHDMARQGAMTAEDFFQAHAGKGSETPLALNIKADGLQAQVADMVRRFQVRNFFVFDMSVPDTIGYLKLGLPVFVRLSEFEGETALFDKAAGIWLDAFEGQWWGAETVGRLQARGKSVAIVSPELHKRPHEACWSMLKAMPREARDGIMLCTDFPEDAERFFHD